MIQINDLIGPSPNNNYKLTLNITFLTSNSFSILCNLTLFNHGL